MKRGDAATAARHLEEAVRQSPQDAAALGYLGAAYGQLGRNEEAVQALARAVNLAPQSAPLQFNLGAALERVGRTAEAAEAYRRALAADGAYERARQALGRLGAAPATTAVPAAPAVLPLGDFLLPIGGTRAAPTPSAPIPPNAAATVSESAPPVWQPPAASGPAVSAPPGFVAGAAVPEPSAAATLSMPAPPSGLRPLGDWAPPADSAPWQPAPSTAPAPDRPAFIEKTHSGATVAVVENPGRRISKMERLGHGYLAGLAQGAWWGLLGAAVFFLVAMATTRSSEVGRAMPIILTLCAMSVALGALLYGLIGIAGAASDDAETLCGNLGLVLGILTSIPVTLFVGLTLGLYGFLWTFGTIWVSRMMGRALGGNINEMQQTLFVVAAGDRVAVTRHR